MSKTILLAGGGTAGHVSPLLATAEAIRRQSPETEILVLGTSSGLEADLVPAAGYPLLTIEKVPFPRKPNLNALRFPWRFANTVREVSRLVKERNVAAVAGFGGYVCPPAYLAARAAGLGIVIHEANRKPGMANRLGARFAAATATAFPGTQLPGAQALGMPMRTAISQLDRQSARAAARDRFGLSQEAPVLLVTGGSLGAKRLNDAVAAAADEVVASGCQILHVTGKGKAEAASRPGYHVVEYVSAMEDAYAAADFAITRSGAGTVCEVSAIGLPCMFVPLPIGNGEQALNGKDLVAAGAALMVNDADFTPEVLRETVLPLLRDQQRLAEMSRLASEHGVRDADEQLATLILTAAESRNKA
ncbi:undecaprenyldiphospho-muramoylpentapeptide beta-N-acetylglucosaminyltransferase [Dermabacteraceae bacterium TAE3-ERU5]|nr:undecaprenyldiphospho-muramoylpentapeptide beta-N-acetylglucosaminyltransferase [Dermabacteraceae bacterium TAE3-ERU5]